MIEDVEEVAQSPVTRAHALGNQAGIPLRQDADRTNEAVEINGHLVGFLLVPPQRLNLAGGESERSICAEVDYFISGIDEPADGLAVREKALEQAHGLEETDSVRFLAEPSFEIRRNQRLL